MLDAVQYMRAAAVVSKITSSILTALYMVAPLFLCTQGRLKTDMRSLPDKLTAIEARDDAAKHRTAAALLVCRSCNITVHTCRSA